MMQKYTASKVVNALNDRSLNSKGVQTEEEEEAQGTFGAIYKQLRDTETMLRIVTEDKNMALNNSITAKSDCERYRLQNVHFEL